MFQMGDDDSEWQGLKYQFTAAKSTVLMDADYATRVAENPIVLNAISYTNSVKTSYPCYTILDQAFIDSTFYGEINFSQTEDAPTGALVYIER